MKQIVNANISYLIHLIGCALDNTIPEELPQDVTWKDIYQLAKYHSINNLIFYSIEKLAKKPDEELYKKWMESRDKAIFKGITQLYERDSIIEKLTEAQIDICPLKGCIIKELYPSQDMRTMADLDILMDSNKADVVKKVFKEMGYTLDHIDEEGHDVYKKRPVMYVEMHHYLVPLDILQKEILQYYKNVWEQLIQDKNNKNLYSMSKEDFYIYHIAHMIKHYKTGGTGIRSFMDIYIYKKHYNRLLDWKYIYQELDKMKIRELAVTFEKVVDAWFQDGIIDDEVEQVTTYVVTSGTYGTLERGHKVRVQNKLENSNNKLTYVIKRAFPNVKTMKKSYTILYKFPIVLPLCWIHRGIKAFIYKDKRKKIKIETDLIKKKKN